MGDGPKCTPIVGKLGFCQKFCLPNPNQYRCSHVVYELTVKALAYTEASLKFIKSLMNVVWQCRLKKLLVCNSFPTGLWDLYFCGSFPKISAIHLVHSWHITAHTAHPVSHPFCPKIGSGHKVKMQLVGTGTPVTLKPSVFRVGRKFSEKLVLIQELLLHETDIALRVSQSYQAILITRIGKQCKSLLYYLKTVQSLQTIGKIGSM